MEEAKAGISFLYRHVLLAGGLVDVFLTFTVQFFKNSWFAMTILTVTVKSLQIKAENFLAVVSHHYLMWLLEHSGHPVVCLVKCPSAGTCVAFRSGSFSERSAKDKAGIYFSQDKGIFCKSA